MYCTQCESTNCAGHKLYADTPLRVSISQFHAGQTVEPVVVAVRRPSGHVRVDLSWFDASDRTTRVVGHFTGGLRAAEKWLQSKDIHLDAGIY